MMKIFESYGKVRIDNFEFYGDIQQDKFCSGCKSNLIYYDDYDSYFCPQCNRWTETKCSDPHCKYCSNRPERPLSTK